MVTKFGTKFIILLFNVFVEISWSDANMAVLVALLVCIIFVFFFQYHWKRRHLYKLANRLEGPPALPIIGNGLAFMCRQEDILNVINQISASYKKPARFWFGPFLVLHFTYAEHLEKILSSSKLAHKHDLYELVKIYLGDGLVSNSGEKYKRHRRLIQPLINLKFASGNIETFQRHIDIFLKKLEMHVEKGTFDIHSYTHACFADIVGESVLGTQMEAQHGKNLDYVHASADMYTVGYDRLMRPWLHPHSLYRLTEGFKDQTRIINITTRFIKDVLGETWERLKLRNEKDKQNEMLSPTSPIVDQIAEIIDKDPATMNSTDFLYHMYTLYVASEDTLTVITAMLFVCLGMYPEYQKIAAEEIRSVFGETPREITHDDLTKLKYLDMCIRDVLRLIPIAPLIVRKTIEDFPIDNLVIPKGCGIVVSIFEVHRDPKHWENPNHFHPDHFLPETVRKRHPFAFVPFSAGPRSCVGKVLALVALKVTMVNILQRFEIEADGKFPDVVLRADITVRSLSGYKVRLKKRVWT